MENAKFTYTYSARNGASNLDLRDEKQPESEAMNALRELDRKISSPGTAAGIAVGVVGTLVFGLGLSCIMVWDRLFLGILVGLIGVAGIALAYPIFDRITKKRRSEYAAELERLTRELDSR